jgi:hypothetical protein
MIVSRCTGGLSFRGRHQVSNALLGHYRLSRRVDESQQLAIEKVEILFDRKSSAIAGSIIACIPIIFGVFAFLNSRGMTGVALLGAGIIGSVCIGFIV